MRRWQPSNKTVRLFITATLPKVRSCNVCNHATAMADPARWPGTTRFHSQKCQSWTCKPRALSRLSLTAGQLAPGLSRGFSARSSPFPTEGEGNIGAGRASQLQNVQVRAKQDQMQITLKRRLAGCGLNSDRLCCSI